MPVTTKPLRCDDAERESIRELQVPHAHGERVTYVDFNACRRGQNILTREAGTSLSTVPASKELGTSKSGSRSEVLLQSRKTGQCQEPTEPMFCDRIEIAVLGRGVDGSTACALPCPARRQV